MNCAYTSVTSAGALPERHHHGQFATSESSDAEEQAAVRHSQRRVRATHYDYNDVIDSLFERVSNPCSFGKRTETLSPPPFMMTKESENRWQRLQEPLEHIHQEFVRNIRNLKQIALTVVSLKYVY